MYFEFGETAQDRFGYPPIGSVALPNHSSTHFRSLSFADRVFRVSKDGIEVIKDRNGIGGRYEIKIPEDELIMLKLKAVPII